MESRTYLKNLRESPKKLRFFLAELKKRTPSVALDYLYYAPQKAGKVLYQALKSALINAKNTLKVPEDVLEWKEFTIEEGQKLKRYKPGGRGTAKPFKIRFSHVKIVLNAKEVSAPKIEKPPQPVKDEKKIESKTEDKRVYDIPVSTKGRSSTGRKKIGK